MIDFRPPLLPRESTAVYRRARTAPTTLRCVLCAAHIINAYTDNVCCCASPHHIILVSKDRDRAFFFRPTPRPSLATCCQMPPIQYPACPISLYTGLTSVFKKKKTKSLERKRKEKTNNDEAFPLRHTRSHTARNKTEPTSRGGRRQAGNTDHTRRRAPQQFSRSQNTRRRLVL